MSRGTVFPTALPLTGVSGQPRRSPGIPEPAGTVESHQATLEALKEGYEILSRVRGTPQQSALLYSDLEALLAYFQAELDKRYVKL